MTNRPPATERGTDATSDGRRDALRLGREAYDRGAWPEAFRHLADADRLGELSGDDPWRLAVAAYLLGRDQDFVATLARACRTHRESGDFARAAWCAFWLGFRLASVGEVARSSGWLARAQRWLEQVDEPCIVEGWLLVPRIQGHLAAGACGEAHALAERAAALADALGDADLHAFALHVQGLARLRELRVAEGLELLDEAMLAVTTDALLPIVSGLVYCSVIAACRDAWALQRAREWTAMLSDWCERQPGLVPFTGTCMALRAEILLLGGAWEEAEAEAQRAEARCRAAGDPSGIGAAIYARAELLRLRGRFAAAERAYAEAAREGRDPQPGLALLRARQGRHGPAGAALRRALEEAQLPSIRARLLSATTEVALAAGDTTAAAAAVAELAAIAERHPGEALRPIVAHARGSVALARGDAAAALAPLRAAQRGWQALEAPYETARCRELLGLACTALGDADTAELELGAARDTYRRLGAAPDLERIDPSGGSGHSLTARELEILRRVAAGGANKQIAADLELSVRTVERHLANIFAKIEVPSRTAAAAFAYEHGLV